MKFPSASAGVSRRVFVCAIFLALVVAAFAANQCFAQVQVASAVASDAPNPLRLSSRPLRTDVNLVLIPATVVDSLNQPVTNLQKHDFQLYDCAEQQEIKYFSQEDAPISIGILVDTSGSMKSKYELARKAVAQLFANSNPEDDYFVITFSETPELLADTTQSIETIENELAAVTPSGGTPLLDAIYLGLHHLKHARYRRRALVIISDGGDNESRYSGNDIRAIAQESDAQIYALGIFSPITFSVEDWAGKKLLSDITGVTGGRAVFMSSPDKLPQTAAQFSRELRSQYVLGYQPKDLQHDGKLHKIKVKLTTTIERPLQIYYKREYVAWK